MVKKNVSNLHVLKSQKDVVLLRLVAEELV
jgi:hypothetical protein